MAEVVDWRENLVSAKRFECLLSCVRLPRNRTRMAAKACSSAFLDEKPWSKETTERLKKRGFEFVEKIGYGSFATVYKVAMTRDNKTTTVACKVIDLKTKTARYRDKFFPREIEATRTLQHRYIVHVYEVVNDSAGNFCFIFMQLAKSDVLKEIEAAADRKISENQGRVWCKQLIEALVFLHSKHWVHRDLKVENILISQENNVLLSDFGFMRQQRPDVLSETHCGSLAYAAPEVIKPATKKGPYDGYKADTWSTGVIMFVMHTGEMPFDDADASKVRRQQERVPQIVDSRVMSSNLKSLIKELLITDPVKRMTLKQAIEHAWFKEKGHSDVEPKKGAGGSPIASFSKSKASSSSLSNASSSSSAKSAAGSRSSTSGSHSGSSLLSSSSSVSGHSSKTRSSSKSGSKSESGIGSTIESKSGSGSSAGHNTSSKSSSSSKGSH